MTLTVAALLGAFSAVAGLVARKRAEKELALAEVRVLTKEGEAYARRLKSQR